MLKMDYLDLLRNVTVVLLHIPMPVYVYFSTRTYRHSFFTKINIVSSGAQLCSNNNSGSLTRISGPCRFSELLIMT